MFSQPQPSTITAIPTSRPQIQLTTQPLTQTPIISSQAIPIPQYAALQPSRPRHPHRRRAHGGQPARGALELRTSKPLPVEVQEVAALLLQRLHAYVLQRWLG